MRHGTKSDEVLVREAFALILELRSRQEGPKLLSQAVAFLRMLEQQGQTGALPVVVSIQVMRLSNR
jgi:hypothetical protein